MAVSKPNIIFIMTDQQRADTIAAAGYDHMITPNLDRLAEQGVIFHRCFTQGACCVPARASVFSGKYAHKHGLLTNKPWSGQDNWVELLAGSGYQTVNIGKMHLHPFDAPCGFEHRFVCENKNQPYRQGWVDQWVKFLSSKGYERPLDYHNTMPDFYDRLCDVDFPLPEDYHEDVFIGTSTVEWIRQRSDDRPLFLFVGFAGPHDPFDAPQRYKDMYDGRDIPPPHIAPGELAAKPPEQKHYMDEYETAEHCIAIRRSHFTPERLRGMRVANFAGVTLIDEWVGNILDALDAKGLLENSIVIFTSDHGDALGDNDMVYKWFMYDSMTRVPMLVWGPKHFEPARRQSLVELFDVGPTILDLASVTVPGHIQARSFCPLLTGEGEYPQKQHVFCEEKNMVMVRSDKWKLVHYHGRPYGELYDLIGDPDESKNLFNSADHQDVKQDLIAVMNDWYAATGGKSDGLANYTK